MAGLFSNRALLGVMVAVVILHSAVPSHGGNVACASKGKCKAAVAPYVENASANKYKIETEKEASPDHTYTTEAAALESLISGGALTLCPGFKAKIKYVFNEAPPPEKPTMSTSPVFDDAYFKRLRGADPDRETMGSYLRWDYLVFLETCYPWEDPDAYKLRSLVKYDNINHDVVKIPSLYMAEMCNRVKSHQGMTKAKYDDNGAGITALMKQVLHTGAESERERGSILGLREFLKEYKGRIMEPFMKCDDNNHVTQLGPFFGLQGTLDVAELKRAFPYLTTLDLSGQMKKATVTCQVTAKNHDDRVLVRTRRD